MATRVPEPAYPAKDSAALYGNRDLYGRIGATASQEGGRKLVEQFEVPIRSGKAWAVKKGKVLHNHDVCNEVLLFTTFAGRILRLTTPHGPQVGDLNIWSLHNPRERFWASRTRQLHASHVSIGDRLWSTLPYLRPLCTIVGDSLSEYGVDSVGGRCHDLLGTRCDPYVNVMLSGGSEFDYHCHSNLTRAVMPWGLAETDVHDVLNVFQVTGLNEDGKYFMEASPAKAGDYFDLFAETDLLVALSACPGGDLSVYGWGEESAQRMLETCRALGVEIYDIADEKVLEGWKEPERAGYKGMHGLGNPVFGK